MNRIVQIKFGSHLYGTATKESDLDIKAVYLPSAKDILLQRVQPVISQSRQKAPGEKNTPADVDFESYSPEKFLTLLKDGQIVALDMLFAPISSMLVAPHPIWIEIQKIAPKILNKKASPFVSYCRKQANKYGIKGSRIAAARKALKFLSHVEEQHGSSQKLSTIVCELNKLCENNEFLSLNKTVQPDGRMVSYFEICGKKTVLGASLKDAREIAQRLMDHYGERASAAEKNEGIDWKALSHAVRVGRQAIEFLSTHTITFPRPEAGHLILIKQGKLTFDDVSHEIETLLEDVETAAEKSTLPDSCDENVIDEFIENVYRKIVISDKK